jgi:hypothetical protein
MATTVRKDLTHLCRALKTPSLLASIDRLSRRAREESWSHEEFLAACLERELSSRQTHGGDNRIKAVVGIPWVLAEREALCDEEERYVMALDRSGAVASHL